jgi:uncharacterized membrane protein
LKAELEEKIKGHFAREHTVVLFVMLAGVILRIRQYLTGRSLWLDEAMLALNIVNRSFFELFKPLDYDQGAPIGFLMAEKVFNVLFGRTEYALRLFPLILGLLSLWLFYLVLRHFVHGTNLVIAVALFAFNPHMIYYSSEVKQYKMDVFVIITLLLVTISYFEKPSSKRLGMITIAGVLALWFSHPALFLLAGIGLTLFLLQVQKRNLANLKPILGMGILWLANIGFLYFLSLGSLRSNAYMREYWQDAFAPMPPWSNIQWYWEAFQSNADTHFAVTFAPWLLFLLLLAGWIHLLRQKKEAGMVIGFMLFFTLLASSLKLYPSMERMVLFLTPIGILLIGMSMAWIGQMLRNYRIASMAATLLITVYLFYGAIPRTVEQFVSPKYFEHIRPAMAYLQGAWKQGDSMYVSTDGVPAFEYYAPIYGLEDVTYLSGQRDAYADPSAMLVPLMGKNRVWVLMSHVYEKGDFNEHDFLHEYFKQNGIKRRAFIEPGTSVYLYMFDLGQ